jgi:hypothetical protein
MKQKISDKPNDEIKTYPTIGGTTFGYLPEYLNPKKEGEWLPVPYTAVEGLNGIPFPRGDRCVLDAIHLLGSDQARAIAWIFSARAAAVGQTFVMRIVEYKIVFDIKAYKAEVENL